MEVICTIVTAIVHSIPLQCEGHIDKKPRFGRRILLWLFPLSLLILFRTQYGYRGECGSGDGSCGLAYLPLDIFVIVIYSWSPLGHMIV